MKKRIKHVGVLQCGKTFGAIYFLLALPFLLIMLPWAIALEASVGLLAGLALLVLMPVLYGVAAFLGGLLTAWLYNIVAARYGGIEFTTSEVVPETT